MKSIRVNITIIASILELDLIYLFEVKVKSPVIDNFP